MSLYDYNESRVIASEGFTFYALIMAAMRQADTINLQKLQREFPKVWEELQQRYNAPGGILEHEYKELADTDQGD